MGYRAHFCELWITNLIQVCALIITANSCCRRLKRRPGKRSKILYQTCGENTGMLHTFTLILCSFVKSANNRNGGHLIFRATKLPVCVCASSSHCQSTFLYDTFELRAKLPQSDITKSQPIRRITQYLTKLHVIVWHKLSQIITVEFGSCKTWVIAVNLCILDLNICPSYYCCEKTEDHRSVCSGASGTENTKPTQINEGNLNDLGTRWKGAPRSHLPWWEASLWEFY